MVVRTNVSRRRLGTYHFNLRLWFVSRTLLSYAYRFPLLVSSLRFLPKWLCHPGPGSARAHPPEVRQSPPITRSPPVVPRGLIPPPRQDWQSYANASSATAKRTWDAVTRFCARTHLGRCDDFSTLPTPTLVHDLEEVNAHADQQDRIVVYTGLLDTLGVRANSGRSWRTNTRISCWGMSRRKRPIC